ncbi:unnamed protein product [Prorocentrum cordatum]|uniref:Uncharacterized protein n=1 Tax=Prorocentrum cordatum TaxID=2364126 RepID=A0ABN9USM7_9DINO|nr:unnamed protein product [Polarella glacialis]
MFRAQGPGSEKSMRRGIRKEAPWSPEAPSSELVTAQSFPPPSATVRPPRAEPVFLGGTLAPSRPSRLEPAPLRRRRRGGRARATSPRGGSQRASVRSRLAAPADRPRLARLAERPAAPRGAERGVPEISVCR